MLEAHDGYVSCIKFSPDETKLLSSSEDTRCILWDVATGTPIETFEGHCADVMCVDFTPDGGQFVSASCDKTVKLWTTCGAAAGRQCLATGVGHTHDVNSVSVSSDGRLVVSGSDDSTVRVWGVPSLVCIRVLHTGLLTDPTDGAATPISSVAIGPSISPTVWSFLPARTVLLGMHDSSSVLSSLRHLHPHVLRRLFHDAFPALGLVFAAAGSDGVMRVWDDASRRRVDVWLSTTGLTQLCFSDCGAHLLVASFDSLVRRIAVRDVLGGTNQPSGVAGWAGAGTSRLVGRVRDMLNWMFGMFAGMFAGLFVALSSVVMRGVVSVLRVK